MERAANEMCTVDEFFALERESDIRHEYLGGEVHAMGGATDTHGRIALNLAASLHRQLKGGPCEAFVADMMIRSSFKGSEYFYYPDVAVCCDPTDNAPLFRARPTALFEVVSDSTRRTDHREKWMVYSNIAELRYYVLIEQSSRHLALRRIDAAGQVSLEELTDPAASLELEEIGVTLPLADIYERVTFEGRSRS